MSDLAWREPKLQPEWSRLCQCPNRSSKGCCIAMHSLVKEVHSSLKRHLRHSTVKAGTYGQDTGGSSWLAEHS